MTITNLDTERLRYDARKELLAAQRFVDLGELWPALRHAAAGGVLVARYGWRKRRGL